MPNRFRPGVLPDYQARTQPGEEIARAVEGYEAAGDREMQREAFREQMDFRREDREFQREDRDFLRSERGRAGTMADLEFDDMLRDRGLTPVTPRSVEAAKKTIQEPVNLPGSDDMFSPQQAGRGSELRDAPGFFRDELDPSDIRGAFQAQGEAGPDAADTPVLLPGQFRPGAGFAPKTVYLGELPEFNARERMAERPRVRAGGMEFEQTGPTQEERRSEESRLAMEAMIEAGVPENVAQYAVRDPQIARSFIRPGEQEAERIPVEELTAAGIAPALAQLASRDPILARQILSARETARLRPATGTGTSGGRVAMEDLLELGIDPAAARLAVNDQVLARQLVQDALRGPSQERLPDRVRERRSSIVSTLQQGGSRITEPWHQDIVDMLAGVDASGRPGEPMSAEDILAGFQGAGTPPEDMRRIQSFLRPFTLRR